MDLKKVITDMDKRHKRRTLDQMMGIS